MKKGEIFRVEERQQEGYMHYFVFWKDTGEGSYLGVMLTHSSSERYKNMPMEDSHFKCGYKIKMITPISLIKDIPSDNLYKVGELTNEGIEYIDSYRSEMKIKTWRDYKNDQLSSSSLAKRI